MIGVLLIDNSGVEEICINMDLIRLGLAELDSSHACMDKQGLYFMHSLTLQIIVQ